MEEEEVIFEAKRKRRRSTPFGYEYDGQSYFCFGSDIEALFFERKDEALVRCKIEGCPHPLYKQRFGRGFSNIKSHLATHHRDRWQKEIFDAMHPNQTEAENAESLTTITSSTSKKTPAATLPSSPKTPAPSSSKTSTASSTKATLSGKNGDHKTGAKTPSSKTAAPTTSAITTTMTTTNKSSQLPESFKKKLYRRKIGNEHECEICSQIIGDLEVIQIIENKYKDIYERDFPFNRQLPASLNDANNGLLLCSNCFVKYHQQSIDNSNNSHENMSEEVIVRNMQIDCTGTIHLKGFAKKINYLKLDGKKVPWADLIDHDHHYPSSATLEYAMNLQKTLKKRENKRSRDEAMTTMIDDNEGEGQGQGEEEKGKATTADNNSSSNSNSNGLESIEDDDSEDD